MHSPPSQKNALTTIAPFAPLQEHHCFCCHRQCPCPPCNKSTLATVITDISLNATATESVINTLTLLAELSLPSPQGVELMPLPLRTLSKPKPQGAQWTSLLHKGHSWHCCHGGGGHRWSQSQRGRHWHHQHCGKCCQCQFAAAKHTIIQDPRWGQQKQRKFCQN